MNLFSEPNIIQAFTLTATYLVLNELIPIRPYLIKKLENKLKTSKNYYLKFILAIVHKIYSCNKCTTFWLSLILGFGIFNASISAIFTKLISLFEFKQTNFKLKPQPHIQPINKPSQSPSPYQSITIPANQTITPSSNLNLKKIDVDAPIKAEMHYQAIKNDIDNLPNYTDLDFQDPFPITKDCKDCGKQDPR